MCYNNGMFVTYLYGPYISFYMRTATTYGLQLWSSIVRTPYFNKFIYTYGLKYELLETIVWLFHILFMSSGAVGIGLDTGKGEKLSNRQYCFLVVSLLYINIDIEL